MSATAMNARLDFLVRVTQKECTYLLETDGRLFAGLFTIEDARRITIDHVLAERLDAFVSRFGTKRNAGSTAPSTMSAPATRL